MTPEPGPSSRSELHGDQLLGTVLPESNSSAPVGPEVCVGGAPRCVRSVVGERFEVLPSTFSESVINEDGWHPEVEEGRAEDEPAPVESEAGNGWERRLPAGSGHGSAPSRSGTRTRSSRLLGLWVPSKQSAGIHQRMRLRKPGSQRSCHICAAS